MLLLSLQCYVSRYSSKPQKRQWPMYCVLETFHSSDGEAMRKVYVKCLTRYWMFCLNWLSEMLLVNRLERIPLPHPLWSEVLNNVDKQRLRWIMEPGSLVLASANKSRAFWVGGFGFYLFTEAMLQEYTTKSTKYCVLSFDTVVSFDLLGKAMRVTSGLEETWKANWMRCLCNIRTLRY